MIDVSDIAALRISLASPEQIRSWSGGEVENPRTINYKTGKPEPGGLFCERIFGPELDRFDPVAAALRRQRMGHIELAAPIAHPWFARGTASVMARVLGLSKRQLDCVLSYSASIVTSIDEARRAEALTRAEQSHREHPDLYALLQTLAIGTVLEDKQLAELADMAGVVFRAGRGAGVIGECLGALDLASLSTSLRQRISEHGTGLRQAIKRLLTVEAFRASGIDPAWMVFPVIPVLPPALRPLVELSNGRLATNDLNALYERVICRNERIKNFMKLEAPEIILNNEKRLLQDACDALFDNAHRKTPVLGSRHQPLKSLTDVISGKGGRFRKNLLGKRVDYSARSVIVGDPTLRLHQCGLPTKVCLELFKPFLIRRLVDRHFAASPHAAKRMVERTRRYDPVIWDALEEVMYEKAVLLNRAPTLHRLSIQAFEAVRVEGSAIRLHPLVCSAYNADFDGDQMAVHLPLSDEAQAEAWELLLSTHNLRSSASGDPSISLGQDIALGLSYLTQRLPSTKSAGRIFTDANEAQLAAQAGIIDVHTRIVVRLADPSIYDAPGQRKEAPLRSRACSRVETTLGRLLFNEALPDKLRFRNYQMTKERTKQLVADCLRVYGPEETADLADRLKTLGFHYATLAGISFAISDIETLPEKRSILEQAHAQALDIEELRASGMIAQSECEQQLVDLWTETTEVISTQLQARLHPYGTLATIINSGATKAKFQQIRQLAGIRGLMAGPGGRIIPIPILGNYLEGLQIWEAFLAASGARDAFMARSLNTAITGYLTRKLVEVGQEVWVTMHDCGSTDSIAITNGESQSRLGLSDMSSRLTGRVLAEHTGVYPAGTLLDEAQAQALANSDAAAVRVRSPLCCQAHYGICRLCYGRDLATGQLVRSGTAVGVIAGQSIGEPGTQLSMRVFHTGGIAGAQGDIRAGLPRVIQLFEAQVPKDRAEISRTGGEVDIEKDDGSGALTVHIATTYTLFDEYPLPPASQILVEDSALVRPGQALAQVPAALGHVPVIARTSGQVRLSGDGLPISICTHERETYSQSVSAHRRLVVEQGQQVAAGAPLTTGTIDPSDLLRTLGCEATAHYLVGEVQQVFRGTGVYIAEKHVEVIVGQMLRHVLVTDPADSACSPGQILDRFVLEEQNARTWAEGGRPAQARPILLGLTKTALHTRSWVAAASFQNTSRVLTWAAMRGLTDDLYGLKARIVVGKPIPSQGKGP